MPRVRFTVHEGKSRVHSTETCFPVSSACPSIPYGVVRGSVRVALYARVSTMHNQNPEMQLSELRSMVPAEAGKLSLSTSMKASVVPVSADLNSTASWLMLIAGSSI